MDETVRTRLLAVSGVTDLLATGPHGVKAIYCGNSPQDCDAPRIEIDEQDLEPYLALDGTYGMRQTTVDVICKAASRPTCNDLADEVETALNDYTGTPTGGVTVDAVMLVDRTNSNEPADAGTDERLYVTVLEYDIQHS